MPYSKLSEAPPQIKKHRGAKLTLAQVNFWARIYDQYKEMLGEEEAAKRAWGAFHKRYKKVDGKWVAKKKKSKK